MDNVAEYYMQCKHCGKTYIHKYNKPFPTEAIKYYHTCINRRLSGDVEVIKVVYDGKEYTYEEFIQFIKEE